MKKSIIVSLVVCLISLGFVFVFYADPSLVVSDVYTPNKKSPSAESSKAGNLSVVELSTQRTVDVQRQQSNTVNNSQKDPIGVFYLDINGDMPAEAKEGAQKAIENLRLLGSISGGEITHEFQKLEYSRDELIKLGGVQGLVASLSFKPFDPQSLLDRSFMLTGARVSGAYVEKKGYGSVYRLFESADGRKLEMNETYMDPGNVSVYTFREVYNQKIANTPVSMEKLKSDTLGNIINLSWFSNQREYGISTTLSEQEAISVARNIINHPVVNPQKQILSVQEQKIIEMQKKVQGQTNPFSLPSINNQEQLLSK